MPVADMDLLFSLNLRDKKHEKAVKIISSVKGIKAPDTALLEFLTTFPR